MDRTYSMMSTSFPTKLLISSMYQQINQVGSVKLLMSLYLYILPLSQLVICIKFTYSIFWYIRDFCVAKSFVFYLGVSSSLCIHIAFSTLQVIKIIKYSNKFPSSFIMDSSKYNFVLNSKYYVLCYCWLKQFIITWT